LINLVKFNSTIVELHPFWDGANTKIALVLRKLSWST